MLKIQHCKNFTVQSYKNLSFCAPRKREVFGCSTLLVKFQKFVILHSATFCHFARGAK